MIFERMKAELMIYQKYNAFMMLEVRHVHAFPKKKKRLTSAKDPAVQKATGKTAPVDVMAKLREMKNSM